MEAKTPTLRTPAPTLAETHVHRIAPAPRYWPALDGLRGVAVAAVILFHAGFAPAKGGFLGVSLFFTLSGFLIATLLLHEHDRNGFIDFAQFWTRRLRRLAPTALAGIALAIVVVGAGGVARAGLLHADVGSALAYLANWRFAIGDRSYAALFSEPSPLLHYWSLAIEEQFYLVFPVVLSGLLWQFRNRYAPVAASLGLLLAGSVASGFLISDTNFAYYATNVRVAELLVGVLLALALAGRAAPSSTLPTTLRAERGSAAVGAAAFAALLASGALWSFARPTAPWLFHGGLLGVSILSATMIYAGTRANAFARAMSWEPLRALGRVSYGLYVFHWPIFMLIDHSRTGMTGVPLFAARLVVSATVTIAWYHALECPIRYGRLLRPGAAVRIAYVVPVVGLLVAAGGVSSGSAFVQQASVSAPSISQAISAAKDQEGAVLAAPAGTRPERAAHGARPRVEPKEIRRVLMVGDSLVGWGFDTIKTEWGRNGVTAAYAGGPGTGPLSPPGSWRQQLDDWMTQFRPDVVVFETLGSYVKMPEDPAWRYRLADGSVLQPGTPQLYRLWATEERRLVARARAGGAEVYWLIPPPVRTNGFYGPLEDHLARLDFIQQHLGVPLVDWGPAVAPGGEFTWDLPGPDGRPTRVRQDDGVHLTDYGNEIAARALVEQVCRPKPGTDRCPAPAAP
jgi:peptidoglycan/LPS O-acetylase OafA/YrhL